MRVFLPTYGRPALLPRALAALRAQTLTQWICELHNDDPADPRPGELVKSLGDPRIHFFHHDRNLGAIKTFNLFYRETAEPFYALLEDDNTWDPTFLATLVDALQKQPQATLAWCNQRLEREQPDGTCRSTGQLVNPAESENSPPRMVPWGQWRQAMGAVHANGAMLMRSSPGQSFSTPAIPFGGVETFRERLIPHPLLYVPQALATYTVTRQSARASDLPNWGAFLVAAAATFLRHAELNSAQFAACWKHFAEQSPPMTNELIGAALICPENRALLKKAKPRDWLRFIGNCIRRPTTWCNVLQVRTSRPEWWTSLDHYTALRFAERKSQATRVHETSS